MPCLFAHYVFGQKIRKNLPDDMRECIDTYEDQFNLGLQGPDFLFYFRPLHKNSVNQLGYKLHEKSGEFYIRRVLPIVRRKGVYSPECAYLMGFLCHYMLDSRCHPYVEQNEMEKGFAHVDMEGEFDKFLMKKRNLRPETFPAWKLIPADSLTMKTVSNLYPWLKEKDAAAGVLSFRFYKWLLTAQNPVKKKILIGVMKKAGLYEELRGQYLWDETRKGTEMISIGLFIHMEEERNQTVEMEKVLWELIKDKKKKELPKRLSLNFSGRS